LIDDASTRIGGDEQDVGPAEQPHHRRIEDDEAGIERMTLPQVWRTDRVQHGRRCKRLRRAAEPIMKIGLR
jgi:hypothetical protein